MEKRFICNGTKYEMGGPTIGLPIEISNLPEQIKIEDETLLRRTDFHVSLVCISQIAEMYKITAPHFMEEVEASFCDFVQKVNIDFLRFNDEFRFVRLGEKASVVVMCDISNLDKFFDMLNAQYGVHIEYPPTHVTLFTKQLNSGIGLIDSANINERSKAIPNPISHSL